MDPSTLNTIDISGFQVSIVEKQSEMPVMSKIGIPTILSDMEFSKYGFESYTPSELQNFQKAATESLLVGSEAPFRQCMRPEFIRLVPPLHVCEDELAWLNPKDDYPELLLETNLTSNVSVVSEVRKIMAKAFKSPLNITEQTKLLNTLSSDTSFVHHIGLTPNKLASLVENNPLVSIEILLKLGQTSQITEYITVLVKMEMSVHSMEVVNRLVTTSDIPTDFLLFYVRNCITTCENFKDKNLQKRSIRLLCVFLQSLIRNKILDAKDLMIEVQQFCLDFSEISEASALFRLLRQMGSDSTNANQAQSSIDLIQSTSE